MASVLVVEAWYRGSHAAWADRLRDRSRHDVALCTHPGSSWKWRVQGGPVTLAHAVAGHVAAVGPPDVLVTTSAVDASALLGLARRSLRSTTSVVHHLHENQLTYPLHPGETRDLTYAMADWRSMCAADVVVFNSEHHRSELTGALGPFLERFPDRRHTALLPAVLERSRVIGVGVDVARFRGERQPSGTTRVLWNHRWEHDKDPRRFVAAIERQLRRTPALDLVIAGSNLDEDAVRADLGPLADSASWIGSVDDERYPGLLRSCDVVVSTARHEFYGMAVLEAVAAGAVPVLPHALAYPEHFPEELHPEVLYRDDEDLDRLLDLAITDATRRATLSDHLREHARTWDATDKVEAFDQVIDGLSV